MKAFTIDQATITIKHDGPNFDPDFQGYRQKYTYVIKTPEWEYVGNDIESGVDANPDENSAASSLFSFLGACAESRTHNNTIPGGERCENSGLFPEHVGQWAEENSDEISMLELELSDEE